VLSLMLQILVVRRLTDAPLIMTAIPTPSGDKLQELHERSGPPSDQAMPLDLTLKTPEDQYGSSLP